MRILQLLAIGLLILAGCGGPVIENAPDEIANVPSEVVIGGKLVHFEASLNRDFMPICPSDGSPMGAFFRVTTVDKSYFPEGVRAVKAWVIYNNRAWTPKFDEPNTVSKKDHGRMALA